MTRVLPSRRVSSAWPERVVDLVGAGVGEVLALQVDAEAARQAAPVRRPRSPARAPRRRGGRRGRAASGGRRSARAARAAPTQNRGSWRSFAYVVLELAERRHQRLGHVAAAELAVARPSGRRRRPRAGPGGPGSGRAARFGRSRRAARARFTNSATLSGSFAGARPATRGRSTPDATSTPTTAEPRERPRRPTPAIEAAGERHRQLAGDGGDERRRRRGCRCRRDAGRPRCRGGAASRPPRGSSRPRSTTARRGAPRTSSPDPPRGRWSTFQAGRPIAGDQRRRLVAGELDRVGVERGHDLGDRARRRRRR